MEKDCRDKTNTAVSWTVGILQLCARLMTQTLLLVGLLSRVRGRCSDAKHQYWEVLDM